MVEQTSDLDDVKTRRLRDIIEEGWDIFLRVVEGNIVLTAVVVKFNFVHRNKL